MRPAGRTKEKPRHSNEQRGLYHQLSRKVWYIYTRNSISNVDADESNFQSLLAHNQFSDAGCFSVPHNAGQIDAAGLSVNPMGLEACCAFYLKTGHATLGLTWLSKSPNSVRDSSASRLSVKRFQHIPGLAFCGDRPIFASPDEVVVFNEIQILQVIQIW